MTALIPALSPVVLAVAFLVGAGCYNPRIEDGKLGCAPEGKECPDGFHCGPAKLCLKNGTPGSGGQGTTGSGGVGGGVPGSGGMSGTGGAAPVLVPLGETCLLQNEGGPGQSDNCDQGLLCMSDCTGGARCYQICDTDADCPQSSCTRTNPDKTQKLCEVAFTMCNPEDRGTGGCRMGFHCALVGPEPTSSGGDQTICDCSYARASTGMNCTATRDCFAGLTCPPVGALGGGYCRQVCNPTTGCSSGSCRPYGARWGYCS